MRTGFDQEGMSSFARGASDLGQFVQLFDHMATLARPIQAEATNAFKQELLECVRAIESALKRQDLVMMSDEIETNLVPLLQGWDAVAQELHAGLESQAIGL